MYIGPASVFLVYLDLTSGLCRAVFSDVFGLTYRLVCLFCLFVRLFVCMCALGSAKLPNGFEKFFLRLVDLNVDIVRKILDFYMSQSISTNWIIG